MASKQRHIIFIDGKWQGGSFGSRAEAEAVAKKLCHGSSKRFEVRVKGEPEPPKK